MTTFNKNMLSPLGFTFNIDKLPEFNHFVQAVTVPGIALGQTERPSPFKQIPVYGDHITYGELAVDFRVNEDLGNYIEIFNWIQGIGFPDDFEQYKNLKDVEVDCNLIITSSNMNPIMKLDFISVFPTALTDIRMDSKDASVEYIEATATFRFLNYTFTKL